MISSLYRMPKVLKPTSPSTDTSTGKNNTSTYSKVQQIDVRTIALQLFRDQIIYPIFHTLHDCLNEIKDQYLGASDLGYQQPRLQQMYVDIDFFSPRQGLTNRPGFLSWFPSAPHQRQSHWHPLSRLLQARKRFRLSSASSARHSYTQHLTAAAAVIISGGPAHRRSSPRASHAIAAGASLRSRRC